MNNCKKQCHTVFLFYELELMDSSKVALFKNKNEKLVVIDGIRSLIEVEEFKKNFPIFVLCAIHSSPKTRYYRLLRRRRSDDPPNWESFLERDYRELGIGMGSVISVADYMVVNEGTLGELKQKIMQVIKKVHEK